MTLMKLFMNYSKGNKKFENFKDIKNSILLNLIIKNLKSWNYYATENHHRAFQN